MARAKMSYVQNKRAFPKVGTPEYKTLQNQAVQYLVQQREVPPEGRPPRHQGEGQGGQRAPEAGQGPVLQRRRPQVSGQPQAAGSDRGAGAHGDREPADLREDLREGDRGREDSDSDIWALTTTSTRRTTRSRPPVTCAISSSRRRRWPTASTRSSSRRQLRRAREEVLDRPGLEAERRQAHRPQGARPFRSSTRPDPSSRRTSSRSRSRRSTAGT